MRQNYIRNVDKDSVPQNHMLQMIIQEIKSDEYLLCIIQMLLVRPP